MRNCRFYGQPSGCPDFVKMEKLKQVKWEVIITIAISICALIFSIYSHFENIRLQEKYNALSTYGMSLNYQINFSDKEGDILLDDTHIEGGQIEIAPITGGIEKVYAIHYYKNNVKAILSIDPYLKEITKRDASDFSWALSEYSIDIIAQSATSCYGTLYLIIKDYQNNYYTNMLVYEFNKNNFSDYKIRKYSDIDLLHIYNNDIQVLPDFDASQMKEYQSLKEKLDEIN